MNLSRTCWTEMVDRVSPGGNGSSAMSWRLATAAARVFDHPFSGLADKVPLDILKAVIEAPAHGSPRGHSVHCAWDALAARVNLDLSYRGSAGFGLSAAASRIGFPNTTDVRGRS